MVLSGVWGCGAGIRGMGLDEAIWAVDGLVMCGLDLMWECVRIGDVDVRGGSYHFVWYCLK